MNLKKLLSIFIDVIVLMSIGTLISEADMTESPDTCLTRYAYHDNKFVVEVCMGDGL